MSSDKDVLGKADALLRRHTVAPPASGSDTGGVPVLTELVGEPPALAVEGADDLAQEVFERVMAEVEGRLAADLERRLADQLVPQMRSAVAAAIGDVRQELAGAIAGAVAEALLRRQVK